MLSGCCYNFNPNLLNVLYGLQEKSLRNFKPELLKVLYELQGMSLRDAINVCGLKKGWLPRKIQKLEGRGLKTPQHIGTLCALYLRALAVFKDEHPIISLAVGGPFASFFKGLCVKDIDTIAIMCEKDKVWFKHFLEDVFKPLLVIYQKLGLLPEGKIHYSDQCTSSIMMYTIGITTEEGFPLHLDIVAPRNQKYTGEKKSSKQAESDIDLSGYASIEDLLADLETLLQIDLERREDFLNSLSAVMSVDTDGSVRLEVLDLSKNRSDIFDGLFKSHHDTVSIPPLGTDTITNSLARLVRLLFLMPLKKGHSPPSQYITDAVREEWIKHSSKSKPELMTPFFSWLSLAVKLVRTSNSLLKKAEENKLSTEELYEYLATRPFAVEDFENTDLPAYYFLGVVHQKLMDTIVQGFKELHERPWILFQEESFSQEFDPELIEKIIEKSSTGEELLVRVLFSWFWNKKTNIEDLSVAYSKVLEVVNATGRQNDSTKSLNALLRTRNITDPLNVLKKKVDQLKDHLGDGETAFSFLLHSRIVQLPMLNLDETENFVSEDLHDYDVLEGVAQSLENEGKRYKPKRHLIGLAKLLYKLL
jgi:hypothetical protein